MPALAHLTVRSHSWHAAWMRALAACLVGFLAASGASAAIPSVALIVYTYHGDVNRLDLLLRSVAIFWPAGWETVVLLDADGPLEEKHLAAWLPGWVRVAYIQPSPYRYYWRGAHRSEGYLRAQYAPFWYDQHTKADFIAHIDADTVLSGFALPTLLFDYAGRPIIHGNRDRNIFDASFISLGFPFVAEFMEAHPLLIRRSHLAEFRAFMVSRSWRELPFDNALQPFSEETRLAAASAWAPSTESDDAFDEAFTRVTDLAARMPWCENEGIEDTTLAPSTSFLVNVSLECTFIFHNSVAHFLFLSHPEDYAFSVFSQKRPIGRIDARTYDGYAGCPALHGSVHLPYVWNNRTIYGIKNQTTSWLNAHYPRYFRFARFFVRVGICAAHKAARPHELPVQQCVPPFRLPQEKPYKNNVGDPNPESRPRLQWTEAWRALHAMFEWDSLRYWLFLAGCGETVCFGLEDRPESQGNSCGPRSLEALHLAAVRALQALDLNRSQVLAKFSIFDRPWLPK